MNRFVERYRGHAEPLLTERRVELVLLVLVAIFLLQLLWGGARLLFPAQPAAVVPTADVLRVAPEKLASIPDAGQRAEIRDRPLFWEPRRPVAPEPPKEAVAEQEKEPEVKLGQMKNVTLTGVFGSGDYAGIIYLAKGKEQRIMVGEEINGWKLESVEPDRAVFQGNGQSAELNLKWGTIQVSTPASQGAAQEAGAAPAAKAEEQTLSLGGRRGSSKGD